MNYSLFSLAICFMGLFVASHAADESPELKTICLIAYDVGSTTTRAEIGTKTNNKWQIEASEMAWISTFHMQEHSVIKAFEKFQRFRAKVRHKAPKNCEIIERGIGTAGLRGSGEWGILFEKWLQNLGIAFQIVTQDEESLLGLKAAKFRLGDQVPKDDFCIWDIGGGSAQLLCEKKGSYTIAGSEISVRNVFLLWDASHCSLNEPLTDELSCKLHNLFKQIDQEEYFIHDNMILKLFPIEALNTIKSIVHKNHIIFGVGPVHQYFGLESLKSKGILKDENDYEFEALDKLLRLQFIESNRANLLNILPIYITLVLLEKPTVRVVPEVNNALGLFN